MRFKSPSYWWLKIEQAHPRVTRNINGLVFMAKRWGRWHLQPPHAG